jgi:tetratricopeptide (TPR) repeat protein
MQESLKHYTDDTRRSHGVEVEIRVGLNSGEVVVRSVGSDLRMDYTAVGQTTHLAARMEQLATPGTVRLTAATMRLAEGYVEARSLGPIPVKGLPEPIEIFTLTGAGPARTRLQAAVLRGLTRFVGRDAEVEHLRRVLGQASAGRGQVVAIVGEAGVGKSRLTYEFTHTYRVQDWLILESSSVSYGKASSYLPVIDLLKGYFKIGDRDDHREMRAKVLGRVLGLDRALEPLLPPLLALLDVPVEDPAWQNLDPPQRRQRMLDAVKRLLLRESQVQPLLVVFEDLHWVDGETQALLDGLVESLGSARLVLLVNYRPEYEHRWGSKTAYSQLRLDSLPAESAGELLAALLGPDPGLAPLTQMLVKRGNPFFLEETVRTLVETGALAGTRGAYRLTRPVDALQVPATVQAILAARIDRLPPEEKRLLQAAAVIGEDVPFVLLKAVAEEPEEVLHRGLAHLQAAEFLYETQLFPDLEYTFKHGLTYQVAYTSLLQERRRVLHARIVEALESLYPDRLTEHVERLAHHAFRGELWEKAVRYLRQAGLRGATRSENREAVNHFEQALAALAHLPETRETLKWAIDLRLDLRSSLWPLGELERVLRYLQEAETLARALDDQRTLGWVLASLTHYFVLSGHPTDARQFGQGARAIAETFGDTQLAVGAKLYLGAACLGSGDYRQAEELLGQVAHALEGDLSRERFGLVGFPAVLARGYLALALADRGRFDEGIARGEEGIHLADALDHPYSLSWICWGLACLHGVRGDFGEATRLLDRGLAVCREWNITRLSAYLTASLGEVHARSGLVAEGITLLDQAMKAFDSMGGTFTRPLIIVHRGHASLLAADVDEAQSFAERALALANERGQPGYEAWARHLLGEIALRRDGPDLETAERRYRQATALAADLGMRPLVAHCHAGLAKLYRRMGPREQAEEHSTTATTMFREMGMVYWLERAAAELRESA